MVLHDSSRATDSPIPHHPDLSLSNETLLGMFETMLLARALDERQWILNRQGRQAFVISCQGHEAAQVGSASALRPGLDVMAPYYRDLAAALVFGVTPRDVLLEALSRASGPWTGGRQMPCHYGDPRLRILTSSSVVASQIPHAVGAALASRIRGESSVAICYFGDGGSSEGAFYESLNFASIHKLPVIFFCENNGLAISLPVEQQMHTRGVADKAAAFGVPGASIDGSDLLAVYEATRAALERGLNGEGPSLIDAHVARMTAHSSDDDHTRYRDPDELQAARANDPIPKTREYLRAAEVLDEACESAMQERVSAAVEDALEFALAAPQPNPADALRHVFSERPSLSHHVSGERLGYGTNGVDQDA